MPLTQAMLETRSMPPPAVDRDSPPRRAQGESTSQTNDQITPEGALSVPAVLAAFTILSEDIASLPLILYRQFGRNKFRAFDSAYYTLMHDAPNPEMPSMIFREIMVGHLLGWGNFYAQMIFDSAGDVTELWPLRPDRMMVKRVDGVKAYEYRTARGQPRVFTEDDLLHIPAFGFDGLIGYSRITLARNAIGLALATEKFGSKFFVNDARPGIAINHPKNLGDKAFEHLTKSWTDAYAGVDNSHKPVILEEGMSLTEIGIPPDDAQFIETQNWTVAQIARVFRVPPHMIGDVQRSTSWGSGIDSQEQGYVNHTLRPWMVRIEGALNLHLLLQPDRGTLYYEHLADALLRGDLSARSEAYVKAITNGWMSPNEVRAKENMNPYQGGDNYWRPLNMQPVDASTGAPATGSADQTRSAAGNRQPNNQSAFEPLWREAIARVMKREENDLRGAVRRHLLKGHVTEFREWADWFYSQEHPDFIERQFLAIIESETRALGIAVDHDALDEFIAGHLSARRLSLDAKPGQIPQELASALELDLSEKLAEAGGLMLAAALRVPGGEPSLDSLEDDNHASYEY